MRSPLRSLTLSALIGLINLFVISSVSAATADMLAAAIASPDRPAEDVAQDASRLPSEVLTFAGFQSGMSVFEMEAGGGYFTEILGRAVGMNGSVVMQNPPSFDSFVGEAYDARLGNNRLPTVRLSKSAFDALDAPDNSIDLVTWIMGPHELGFSPGGANLGDPAKTFSEIARILKPGGALLMIDHIAPAGSGVEVGGTLHRITEELATQLASAAGLSVAASSDMFKNAADPLTVGVFDPSIQGKTSKFTVLYRK